MIYRAQRLQRSDFDESCSSLCASECLLQRQDRHSLQSSHVSILALISPPSWMSMIQPAIFIVEVSIELITNKPKSLAYISTVGRHGI
ncbi:hypothetical protein Mapa_017341 [Marchantia paleacea]|nr:hypothetical protein Mapa_017341 [Marchantia paleacea]